MQHDPTCSRCQVEIAKIAHAQLERNWIAECVHRSILDSHYRKTHGEQVVRIGNQTWVVKQ